MLSAFAFCLITCAAGLAGQAAPPAAAADIVVARAGDLVVSSAELMDAVLEARRSGDPKRLLETMTPDGRERIALGILERKALAATARAAGVERQPAVQRALAEAAETVLGRAFVAGEVAAVDTSEAALRRYYDAHQSTFRIAPRRKAHHVVVATRAEAEAVLAELRAGKPLEAIASARNTDGTKPSSGDLGWVKRGVMVRAFDEALFALTEPGQLSGVVATSFGFHVIRLDAIDPGQLPAFPAVKTQVQQALLEAVRTRIKADLAKRYPATVNREALAGVAR